MTAQPIFLAGRWQADPSPVRSFQAADPRTGEALASSFPISGAEVVSLALDAGVEAARKLRKVDPERIAAFLELCADSLEARADALVAAAEKETALPASPRLRDVELPRTTGQLRKAAQAARDRSFCEATIDTQAGIRTLRGPLGGPVVVFGPNNFPFAFNALMGGDFAAAIAAGNPVIGKAHPSHPETSRLLCEAAAEAVSASGLPEGTVQMLYGMAPEVGLSMVADERVAAVAFTGSRSSGLALKQAADAAGTPVYLEMSAINPVFVLPAAMSEKGEAIAAELSASCALGTGQFCTKPGISVVVQGTACDRFQAALQSAFESAKVGCLFAANGAQAIASVVKRLQAAGAQLVTGGKPSSEKGFRYPPTLLRVDGATFLKNAKELQEEAFGVVHLSVIAADVAQMEQIASSIQGSLTGCLYTDEAGEDEAAYGQVAAALRSRVGRLLNDKMPTGVAVSLAMNHGGPFPATGHPGFTSVGLPASITRFTALHCYDNVRPNRLPPELRDENPTGRMWRNIDGQWTQGPVGG